MSSTINNDSAEFCITVYIGRGLRHFLLFVLSMVKVIQYNKNKCGIDNVIQDSNLMKVCKL